MKLSLKKALISAVVVLAGVSLFMPVASVFAVAAPVQTAQPAQAPTPATTASPDTTTNTPADQATTPAATQASAANDSGPDTSVTAARCEGGALGWVLCPVIKLMQDTVGMLERQIVKQLDMGPLRSTGRYENLHIAWAGFRDLANVFFIAIFIAIIFAQTLSLGLDNYSIKMMLPRLIVAAIAIQFSFFIMQIGVDISNVAGNGIAGVFADVIKTGSNGGQAMTTTQALGALTVVGVGGALAAGTIVTGLVVPFLLLILAAALSLLGVILTVWLRVIILQFLVLLAPLAIVAWVMPNTEKWFKAWSNNVVKLLLMYPIIMFMISGGALATHITAVTAQTGPLAKLLSACVPIMVFIAIPMAIKASGSLMNLTGNLVMGRMNAYSQAVRKSTLMQDAKDDFKNKAYLQYADNDLNTIKGGFGAKGKALTRRGMGRIASGNALSFQRFGDAGTRKMAKGIEHARHLLEEDWKTFFRDNAFGNPELMEIAKAGLVHHNKEHETTNSYGTKYKFKMNHHLAEAAVGQMVQQSGMVEFSELMDGEKYSLDANGNKVKDGNGIMRNGANGLFDHEANQWKSKEIQSSMLRALGPNAGSVLQKITHAVHLQGDRAYGELQAAGLANLGAGSGITAAQQAVKWNAANALNSMIQVVNSNGLANSIQLDVAKSMKRELLAADEQGKFAGITINTKPDGNLSVKAFIEKYISDGGQVQALQGDIQREGLDQLIEALKPVQKDLQDQVADVRKRRIAGERPKLGDH